MVQGGIRITEPVMTPVVAMLIGAVLIALELLFSSSIPLAIGIILSIAGVATVIVGMVMLFGIARQKT